MSQLRKKASQRLITETVFGMVDRPHSRSPKPASVVARPFPKSDDFMLPRRMRRVNRKARGHWTPFERVLAKVNSSFSFYS